MIEKSDDIETAKIIGKWSKSLFQRRITYDEFIRGTKCIQRLSYQDFQSFLTKADDEIEIHISNHDLIPIFINEFNFANLLSFNLRTKVINKNENSRTIDKYAKQYSITQIGRTIRQEFHYHNL
ncbi:MAG: hypothetical protein IPL95_07200 [Saprospiraceae bacterium]|nr:hypothetical protein [Saprospiraceae bacterium]